MSGRTVKADPDQLAACAREARGSWAAWLERMRTPGAPPGYYRYSRHARHPWTLYGSNCALAVHRRLGLPLTDDLRRRWARVFLDHYRPHLGLFLCPVLYGRRGGFSLPLRLPGAIRGPERLRGARPRAEHKGQAMNRANATIVSLTAWALSAGCTGGGDFRSASRAEDLMALAAEEARHIPSPRKRLGRLLNTANLQNGRRRFADARRTLEAAAETLRRDGEQLDDHTRLAGWVSISELARAGRGQGMAERACDTAVTLLREVQPVPERCQYVHGVAMEVRALRGDRAAAGILREAAPWAKAIEKKAERREALEAVAADLFLCDDYDGGRDALRCDDDPVWRTDTLLALARRAVPLKHYGKELAFAKVFSFHVTK
jgi:hypothetical protein